jgi:cyclase
MRSKILVIALAAAVGMALAAAKARTQEQPPVDISEVADGLYVVTGPGGNVGVRVTSEGVVVVDDKFADNYSDIISSIESVTDEPIRYVFNTHHHGDHTGGNTQFAALAPILAHENVRTNILRNDQEGPPSIVYADQASVYLGGAAIEAHHAGRGHTDGDSVILFPDLGVIHMGDLYFGGAAPFIDYNNGGSAVEWIDTFDNVLQMDFETVIPGHGNVMTRADLETFRNTFEDFQNTARQLISQGVSEDDFATRMAEEFPAQSVPGIYRELSE